MEECNFVRFGFEVFMMKVVEDKIQDQEPRTNQIVREPPAIAEIIFVDGAVNQSGVEVINGRVVPIAGGAAMPEPEKFLCESARRAAAFHVRKTEKLALGEIPGMSGNEVEELSLNAGVAIILNLREMFRWDIHKDKMSSMISGSCMAGRSRAVSSARAYMAKPALAFAARFPR